MINYALADMKENVIGIITLTTDTIPTLIMDGVELLLGGTFLPDKHKFVNFTLVPVPVKDDSILFVAMLMPFYDRAEMLGVYSTKEKAESRCHRAVKELGYDQPTSVFEVALDSE